MKVCVLSNLQSYYDILNIQQRLDGTPTENCSYFVSKKSKKVTVVEGRSKIFKTKRHYLWSPVFKIMHNCIYLCSYFKMYTCLKVHHNATNESALLRNLMARDK